MPALILGIAVGGSALLAMGATIRGASVGPVLALIAGAIMIGWIVGEMTLLPTNLFTDFATGWLQGVYLPRHGYIGEAGIGGRDRLLAARTVKLEFDQRHPLV